MISLMWNLRKLIKTENGMWLPGAEEWGKWEDVGQREQSSGYAEWIISGYLTTNL